MSGLLQHHLDAVGARWITPELAEAAGLYSVDSATGAALMHRNGRGNYAGIAIPYRRPDGSVYAHRLRRDHPDLEVGSDGQLRPKAKYLSPPGLHVAIYNPPGADQCKSETP